MQTHDDRDFSDWMKSLEEKARRMREAGLSKITSGEPLAEWQYKSVHCSHLPPDEHGILRISIGGGGKLDINYCVFRGNRDQCIGLLRKALKALESR